MFTFFAGFYTVRIIDRNKEINESRWESCSLDPEWRESWQYYAEVTYDLIFGLSAIAIIGISIAIAYILKKRNLPPGFVSNNSAVAKDLSSVTGSCSQTQNTNNNNCNLAPPNSQRAVGFSREKALQRRKRKDKQTMFQLFLIVCSFIIGYVPLTGIRMTEVFACLGSVCIYVTLLLTNWYVTQHRRFIKYRKAND